MTRSTVLPGQKSGEEIAIVLGDMTKIPADVYVVPHFQNGVSWGGVGAAVARAGARGGMDLYERHVSSLTGQQNWGDIKDTISCGGNSRHLIHVVSVGSGRAEEYNVVANATYNALVEAERVSQESIVSPALGTGIIGQLTAEQSARAIFSGIQRFQADHPGRHFLRRIVVAIYGDSGAYQDFASTLASHPIVRTTPTASVPTPKAAVPVSAPAPSHDGSRSRESAAAWEANLRRAGLTEFRIRAADGTLPLIAIAHGDMTRIPADAYVVPHFSGAVSWGGVGAAVARAGGSSGIQAFEDVARQYTQFGQAVATSSGGGHAANLIHVVSVGSGKTQEYAVARESVYNSLVIAMQRGFKSVVFPALGTGIIGQLTDEQSARAIREGIQKFHSNHPQSGIESITIAIFRNPSQYSAFTNQLGSSGDGQARTPRQESPPPSTPPSGEIGQRHFDLGRWLGEMFGGRNGGSDDEGNG